MVNILVFMFAIYNVLGSAHILIIGSNLFYLAIKIQEILMLVLSPTIDHDANVILGTIFITFKKKRRNTIKSL